MEPSAATLAMIVSFSIEGLIGAFASIFIVVVISLDWLESHRLNSVDMILFTLGIFKILLQCMTTVIIYLLILCKKILFSAAVYPVVCQLELYPIFSCFWITACLCVFYCLKITNIQHSLFIWLKLRISRMVPQMILGSIAGSLVLSVPVYWNIEGVGSHNATVTSNQTLEEVTMSLSLLYSITACIIGLCLPLLLVLISVAFIISSLCMHTWRVRQTVSENSQPNLKAHSQAAFTVIGLLIVYTFFFLAVVTLMLLQTQESPFWSTVCTVCLIIIVSFSPAQSTLLILVNSKLRLTFWRILGLSGPNRA